MRRRGAALLVPAAAAGYLAAAWTVAPGFYDGFQPVTPYRWLTPPPSLRSGNQQPLSGHASDPVEGGETAPLTTYTGDGQVVLSLLPGSFQVAPGTSSVEITIKAVGEFPAPDFTVGTNVYLITATAPLVKSAAIQLQYSNMVAAPSNVYRADGSSSAWRNIGASQYSAQNTVSARTDHLGYFAAGYPSNAKPPKNSVQVGGGQVLPIVVAGLILLILLAGIPLALRRRGEDEEEPADG